MPEPKGESESGWTVARRLEDVFDAELVKAIGVSELVPRLGFVLDDLSHLTDEELEGRALGLMPVLTLWALRDARSPERLARSLGRWAGTMAELLHAPKGREALWTLFRYIAAVADDSTAETLTAALEAAEPEVKDALMTIAEKWKAEGEAKGRAEGKAEGKAETSRKLLTLKFGALPEGTARRIASASEPELDRWLERVLTADTLDAVVGA